MTDTTIPLPQTVDMRGAEAITGKSRRTIRRWLADETLSIRTEGVGADRRINTADLIRVNEWKDAYRDTPTFGRPPGTVDRSSRRNWAAKPCVYYARFGDRVKIGYTTNLRNRLNALFYDEVMAIEPGDRELEKQRHQQFAADRVLGQQEWFELSLDLTEHIERLNQTHETREMLREYAPR